MTIGFFLNYLFSICVPLISLGTLGALAWLLLPDAPFGGGAPAPVAKPLMTRREQAMLVVLEQMLPAYRFHAQVSMGAIMAAPKPVGRRRYASDRNAFSQKIVDFVVEDRTTGKIVALIEVDDSTHNASRDLKRDAMTASAGYRTIRIPHSAAPTVAGVMDQIQPLRNVMLKVSQSVTERDV